MNLKSLIEGVTYFMVSKKIKIFIMTTLFFLTMPFLLRCKTTLQIQNTSEAKNAASSSQYHPKNHLILSSKDADQVLDRLNQLSRSSSKPKDVINFLSERFKENYLVKYKSQCENLQENANNLSIDFYSNDGNLALSFQSDTSENDWQILALKREPSIVSTYYSPFKFQTKIKSNTNQPTCSGCHSSDHKPIYYPHPLWPGSLGSIAINSLSDAPRHEQVIFKKLLAKQSQENSPYVPLKNLSTYYEREVNKNFVESMDKILIESFYEKIEKDPRFPYLKFALLGGALSCTKLDDFIPNHFRKYFPTRIEYYYIQTKELMTKNHSHILNLQKTWLPSTQQDLSVENLAPFLSDSYIRTIANLRFLLEGKHKDFSEWFPHPLPNTFTFGFTSAIAGTLPTLLRKDIIKGNESVQCESLQKSSLQALNQLKPQEAEKLFSPIDSHEKPITVVSLPNDFSSYKAMRAFETVHSGCASCHTAHQKINPALSQAILDSSSYKKFIVAQKISYRNFSASDVLKKHLKKNPQPIENRIKLSPWIVSEYEQNLRSWEKTK